VAHRRWLGVGLGAVSLAGMALVAPAPAGAAVQRTPLIGLTTANRLVSFASDRPGVITSSVAVTGLAPGENLLGIDVRPATGALYGVGSTSRLYRIDAATGAAAAVGSGPFTPALTGSAVGFDFNPTVDRIRVVTDAEQNLRLHPDTGAVAATDGALGFAAADPNAGRTGAQLEISGAAYTNSFAGATTTVLFDIDTAGDLLVSQVPPNDGTLNTVGPLGVDATAANGFDIAPGERAGVAALTVGGQARLYEIDLATGRATALGAIGDGTVELRGLAVPVPNGYRLATRNGNVLTFGDSPGLPSFDVNAPLGRPVVGVAPSPTGRGHWLAGSDGGVFAFGDATFFGSLGALTLNKPVVGIAATPTGRGYWLVASDGGVFAFGDATFLGSLGALTLNKPVVGIAATPTGRGYWLVASDGGVFAFGDATFLGSTGARALVRPVVGIDRTLDGKGYWLVASDGGIFAFGNAPFLGSAGGGPLPHPVVGIYSIA